MNQQQENYFQWLKERGLEYPRIAIQAVAAQVDAPPVQTKEEILKDIEVEKTLVAETAAASICTPEVATDDEGDIISEEGLIDGEVADDVAAQAAAEFEAQEYAENEDAESAANTKTVEVSAAPVHPPMPIDVLFLVEEALLSPAQASVPARELVGKMIAATGLDQENYILSSYDDEAYLPKFIIEFGKVLSRPPKNGNLVSTYTPQQLIADPSLKRKTWESLQSVMKQLH